MMIHCRNWNSLLATVLLLATAQGARADINLVRQHPSSSLRYGLLEDATMESIAKTEKWFRQGPLLSVHNYFMSNPLVQFDATGTTRTVLVSYLNALSVSAGYLVSDRIFLGTDFFMGTTVVPGAFARWGAGDTRLFGKIQLLSDVNSLALAVIPEFFFPTGTEVAHFTGSSFAPGFRLVAERDFGLVRIAVETGFEWFMNGTYQTLDYRYLTPISLGVNVPFGKRWALNIEGMTEFLWASGFVNGPSTLFLGGTFKIYPGAELQFGATGGNFQTDGSGSFGVIAAAKLLPLAPTPQDGYWANECGNRPVTGDFYARPLTPEELQRFTVLPYRDTEEHKIPVLQLGQMSGVTSGGIPYVEGSQILFAIDLIGLPARSTVLKPELLALKMEITKISKERSTGTEILCVLDPKVCSGEVFTHGVWKKNVNPEFFEGKETPNDYFAKQYLRKEVGRSPFGKIYSADVTLELRRLLENSEHREVMDLLYGDADPAMGIDKRTLYFAVADDTYVSSKAHLVMSLRTNSCLGRTAGAREMIRTQLPP